MTHAYTYLCTSRDVCQSWKWGWEGGVEWGQSGGVRVRWDGVEVVV